MSNHLLVQQRIGGAFSVESEDPAGGRQANRLSGLRIVRRQKTPGKAGDARLTALNSVFSKQQHAGDRRLVRDGHEGAGGMVQFMPCDDTRLATGQTSHDRIEVAGHCGRLTCYGARQETGCLVGFHDD